MLCTEYNKETAAMTLGWGLEQIDACLASPHIRLFLEQAHHEFLKECAKAKVRVLRKVDINQMNIEKRLMELAQMDPSQTKGTIDGQVKALRTLAETLGMFDASDPLKGKSRQELEGFVTTAAKRLPLPPPEDRSVQ